MDTVLIAGCGGLGRAAAHQFAQTGRPVIAVDRHRDAVDQTVRVVTDAGGTAFGRTLDVADHDAVAACVAHCEQQWGPIGTLVNTAGGTLNTIGGQGEKLLWEHDPADWDLVLRVNLTGSFHWLKSLAPRMIERRRGHLLLVASGSGIKPGRGRSSYTAAKAGVIGLTKAAALELGPYEVRVNAVCPGLTLHDNLTVPPAVIAAYQVDTMTTRLSTPDDFARFVVCLDHLPATLGQVYNLDSKLLW